MSINLSSRQKYTGDKKSRMEFLSIDRIPAFFIEVDMNGQDIHYGNDRTKVNLP